MSTGKLYSAVSYSANIDFLLNNYVREYDISKANINILLHRKLITEDLYNFLKQSDRMVRQVTIGKMLRDNPSLSEELKNGIIETKQRFFEVNNIQDYEVLSIKNDAVYLINKIPKITKFDNIEFACKNIYTSYYKIFNVEYYYYFDIVNNIENIDIKGIGDDKLEYHKNHFLEFLLVIFNSAQVDDIKETINLLKIFSDKYLKMGLDIEYYRNFNASSLYSLKPIMKYSSVNAKFLPEKHKDIIDISHNYNILRELYKIYTSIYFNKIK